MEIELISFGKIAEFIGYRKLQLQDIRNTDELKDHLEEVFPELKGMKYRLALNHQILQSSTALADHDTVAVMPPFSGG